MRQAKFFTALLIGVSAIGEESFMGAGARNLQSKVDNKLEENMEKFLDATDFAMDYTLEDEMENFISEIELASLSTVELESKLDGFRAHTDCVSEMV